MPFKHRSLAWSLAVATAALSVAANALLQFSFGIDVSSLLVAVVVPIGSIAVSFVALSGFVLAARRTGLQTSALDLAFLMLLSVGVAILIYWYQYMAAAAGARGSFVGFVASEVSGAKYSMHMRGMPTNAPPVAAGDAGWLLLIIRVACLLAVARIALSMASPARSSQWRS